MVIRDFGGTEVFEQREVPKPVPKPTQVLVKVLATSVNPLDYQTRRGDYRADVQLPAIIGSDVSGVVEAVGDAVTDFKIGDEVYYTPQIFGGDGSYAEYHVADESIVAHKPRNLSHRVSRREHRPLSSRCGWLRTEPAETKVKALETHNVPFLPTRFAKSSPPRWPGCRPAGRAGRGLAPSPAPLPKSSFELMDHPCPYPNFHRPFPGLG
jgi:hypothetical protein